MTQSLIMCRPCSLVVESAVASVVNKALEAVLKKVGEGKRLSTEDLVVLMLGLFRDMGSEIAEVRREIADVRREVADVRKEVADLRNDTNRRIDEINKRIDSLNDSLSKRIDEIRDALSGRIDETNSRIDALYSLLGKMYEALVREAAAQKQ